MVSLSTKKMVLVRIEDHEALVKDEEPTICTMYSVHDVDIIKEASSQGERKK